MTYNKLTKQYKRTSIETASKLDLIIMCYEKSIQFLIQSKEHFQENEIEKKARKLQKALDIINELKGCLNFNEGGQIATNLDAIYTYITKRLLLGDIKEDLSAFDECIGILEELKSAWVEISSTKSDEQVPVISDVDGMNREGTRVAA